jgi:2-polyprenyl-3-methyl-5-hydroxy-6-metoxy-1,4-benzoquinol methylase
MAFNSLIPILKTKVYSLLHSTILYRFGYGSRVAKGVWEKQYGGTDWDFLFSEDEKAHYLAIIAQINNQSTAPKMLDIGCGHGVLYNYFKKSLTVAFGYTGIDISENAIKKANEQFPEADFKVVNYDFAPVNDKFNIVIFNEVVYYFVKPIKMLQKAFDENLLPGGVVVISMYKDAAGKNQLLWNTIGDQFKVLAQETVVNDKGASWTVKTITTK